MKRATVCGVTLLLLVIMSPAAAGEPKLVEATPVRLAPAIPFAFDVRWHSDESVRIAAGKGGVVEVDLRRPLQPQTVIAGGGPPRAAGGPIPTFFFSSMLGASPQHTVAGSWFRAFAWKPAGTSQLMDVPFANIIDLDLHEDRAVILGVRGDERGRWASVGATLWSAKFTSSAVHFSALPGPDVAPMRACHVLGMGSVRFTADGRLIVAPGVEPDVHLYDRQGRLIRTWQTAKLGYEDRCKVTMEQSAVFSDIGPRREWQNRRQLLDEMVVLPEGPLLIIRQPVANGTRWRGVLLPYDGPPVSVAIPVTSASRHAHLKADVRGSRVAFVVSENLGPDEKAVDAARLIVATLRR